MSDTLDEHLDEELATLDAVSIRELEATAVALERREDHLRSFASVFGEVAAAREGGWDTGKLTRYRLADAVKALDAELAARLGQASSPFWAAVLEARREDLDRLA